MTFKPIKIKKFYPNAALPAQEKPGDAGFDLRAHLAQPLPLLPGERTLVPTGIAVEIPAGWAAFVHPRSGLALKHGVTVLNAPGTVDSGYRGEVGVILINHGKDTFIIEPEMRIAQLIIKKVEDEIVWQEVGELSDSERAGGGFGHSGVK